MKNKYVSLFAAFMIMAAFLLPVTAYAVGNTEQPDVYITTQEDETNNPEETENISDIETTTETPIETPNESVIPDDTEKPFTPDGQASVVDLAYEGDGKMFYTFKTPEGNVFYLIIDRQKEGDNVYFLSAVNESDLLVLAENSDNNNGSTSAIPNNNTSKDEPTTDETKSPDTSATDNQSKEKSSNTGMIIFILIGVAVLGGVGYYFKIVRPKKQVNIDDEDDDIPDDNSAEIEFEDEPEDYDDDSEMGDDE